MADWRHYFSSSWSDDFAHADSPAGGGSTGTARPPDPGDWHPDVPHPDSPAGREFDPLSFLHIDLFDRVQAVREALQIAEDHAAEEILQATGMELRQAAEGFVPGLLMALALVAGPTALGAAGGAALGWFALGIGAVPGAVFGAEVGLEAGIALLEIWGLGGLIASIGGAVLEALALARRGATQAWDSVDKHTVGSRAHEVEQGGRTMAQALGKLMQGILQGVVAYLLAKGTSAAAARVPELVSKLRASRMGERFAAWVERNWQSLLKEERLKPEAPAKEGGAAGAKSGSEEPAANGGGRGSGDGETAPSSKAPPEKSGASSPKPAAEKSAPPKSGTSAEKPPEPASNAEAAPAEEAPAASEGHQVPEDKIQSTGEPVDVATGKVFTDKVDFELPGVLGFRFRRMWFSTSTYAGPLGHGWHHSYDASLRVERDAIQYQLVDGRTLRFPRLAQGTQHFDRKERLTVIHSADGFAVRTNDQQVWRFTPGQDPAVMRLRAIEHPTGRSLQLRYDGLDHLSEVIDGAGRSITFEHDAQGRIASLHVEDPTRPGERQKLLAYAYNSAGDLVSVTDALGGQASFRYDGHQLIQATDRNGLSFYYTYDGPGPRARCTRTRGDDGLYDHKLTYDVPRGVTTVIDSLGHKHIYEHRGGLVRRKINPLGAITLIEYDEHDQKRAEIDALGQRTSYFYDERGNLQRVIRPDGTQLRATYDAHNRLERVIEPSGATWRYIHDAQGRVTERLDPLGQRTRYHYHGAELREIVDAAGQRYELTHDAHGNVTALREPDGSVRHWKYDRLGRTLSALDPAGNEQTLTRDAMGRVTRIREPDGNVRELAYDAEGNLTGFKDQHRTVELRYWGMGLLRARHEAGSSVYFDYDTEERLIGVVNQHGRSYRFERDASGEVDTEIGWGGQAPSYRRDALGRVSERRRGSGLVSRYSYDAAGRVSEVEHSDGTRERYTYTTDGDLLTADNGSCQLQLQRDALGRLTRESRGPHWVQSDYDALGRRVRMRSSLGASQHIRRDAMGRASEISAGPFQTQITRDPLGLELERMLPGGARSHWQRDKLGRPERQTLHAQDDHGPTTRVLQYRWQADNRLAELVDSNHGLVRYGYDDAARLISARYTYGAVDLRLVDEVGNLFRTERRDDRVYGPAGELLEARDERGQITTYRYDEDGNLLEKLEPGERRWRYSWNAAGHLTQVTRPDGSEVSFRYDAFGRRIEKRYRGQTTHYVWDGYVPLHEWVEGRLSPLQVDANSLPIPDANVRRREAELETHLSQGPPQRGSAQQPITWLFEPDSFVPMARVHGERSQSIVTDQLGTPIAMVSGAGRVTWSASSTTYGELHHVKGGPRHACPFRFQGQYEDAETGLYYNRHRYYDPESGSYISQDPIGLAGGLRVYGYVEDPTGWIDPLGLACKNESGRGQPTSAGQMQKEVERGQAPRDVERVDRPHVEGQEPHVHFEDGTSVNRSGTTHDAHRGTPDPPKKTRAWLESHGWTPPPKNLKD